MCECRPLAALRTEWNRLAYVRNIGVGAEWHEWILTGKKKTMEWVAWISKPVLFFFFCFLISCAAVTTVCEMTASFVLLKCIKPPLPPQQYNQYKIPLEVYNCLFVGSWRNHMHSDNHTSRMADECFPRATEEQKPQWTRKLCHGQGVGALHADAESSLQPNAGIWVHWPPRPWRLGGSINDYSKTLKRVSRA